MWSAESVQFGSVALWCKQLNFLMLFVIEFVDKGDSIHGKLISLDDDEFIVRNDQCSCVERVDKNQK